MAFLPRRDVKSIAKPLQARLKTLSAFLAAPTEDLVEVDGLGETATANLKAIAELNSRAAREEIKSREAISAWTALVEYVRREIQLETCEKFRVLFLDRKNQQITDEIMGRVTVDHAPVFPREIIDVPEPFGITVHARLIVGAAGVGKVRLSALI